MSPINISYEFEAGMANTSNDARNILLIFNKNCHFPN